MTDALGLVTQESLAADIIHTVQYTFTYKIHTYSIMLCYYCIMLLYNYTVCIQYVDVMCDTTELSSTNNISIRRS